MSNKTCRLGWCVGLLCFFVLQACVPATIGDGGPPVDTTGTEAGTATGGEITLQMAAGPVSGRLMVTNHSNERFENIVMIVNEENNGGYTLKISKLEAQASLHFGLNAYRNTEGARFDPSQDWVQTLTVFADTPNGRGRWHSSYPKR